MEVVAAVGIDGAAVGDDDDVVDALEEWETPN